MQAIDLYDEITLEKSDSIKLHCSDPALPGGPENLAFKAAAALQGAYHFKGVKIDLIKNIPSGAGLGGGSSDAAFVLRGLCKLYDLKPSRQELSEIAASLGSDIPFFLSGGQALVKGRGEIVSDIRLPLDYEVVIVSPAISISTAEIYKSLKINLTNQSGVSLLITTIDTSGLTELASIFRNDLEEVVLLKFPELGKLKQSLLGAGAFYSCMTGSGSSFFGLFVSGSGKFGELECLAKHGVRVCYCRPIILSPYVP